MDQMHAFYCSKEWRDLAFRLKVERGGRCERTQEVFSDLSKLIAHHKIPLTLDNVNNPMVALNPDNIEIISFTEHNKEHFRFGKSKEVYIVRGSPLSGKTTMVREMMGYGDLVLDVDALWQAVTMQPLNIKPNGCRFNVFALRDTLMDQIKTRYGEWYRAWVIGGYPQSYERERLAVRLGAELIYCDSTKEVCFERRIASGKPSVWDEYITTWWDVFERTPPHLNT